MAATGHDWSAWDFLDYNTGTDIEDIDLNDEAQLTSDEISMDKLSAREIAVKWIEGNDGACDGNVIIYLLGSDGEGNWQVFGTDVLWQVGLIDAVQNTTLISSFRILGSDCGSFKILVDNDSGQDGDLSISSRTADIPVAS